MKRYIKSAIIDISNEPIAIRTEAARTSDDILRPKAEESPGQILTRSR